MGPVFKETRLKTLGNVATEVIGSFESLSVLGFCECCVWFGHMFHLTKQHSRLFIVRLVKYINNPVQRKAHILTPSFFLFKKWRIFKYISVLKSGLMEFLKEVTKNKASCIYL